MVLREPLYDATQTLVDAGARVRCLEVMHPNRWDIANVFRVARELRLHLLTHEDVPVVLELLRRPTPQRLAADSARFFLPVETGWRASALLHDCETVRATMDALGARAEFTLQLPPDELPPDEPLPPAVSSEPWPWRSIARFHF